MLLLVLNLQKNIKKYQYVNACAGGHSTTGYSVLNERLVFGVSRMKGIFIDERKEK